MTDISIDRMLNKIIAATARQGGHRLRLSKRALYGAVAVRLNEISGRAWGSRYIQSVHNGSMKPSPILIATIKIGYAGIRAREIAAARKKTLRPNVRLRPVQVRCSEHQYKRILSLSTAMRAIVLLKGMKDNYKYIKFEKVAEKPKTSVWACKNINSGHILGLVKWYFPWRQYAYFPTNQAVYSKGCLDDISDFLVKLR